MHYLEGIRSILFEETSKGCLKKFIYIRIFYYCKKINRKSCDHDYGTIYNITIIITSCKLAKVESCLI